MTFKKAQREMEKLADGEYYSLKYFGNDSGKKYNVYIHGYDSCFGASWKEAISQLKKEIKESKKGGQNGSI